MAFKMKGNPYKMGKMATKSALKATAEEMREAGVSEGTIKLADKARSNPKMDNDKWKAGSDAAKKNTGRSLNELVASRKGLEKGSNEYNKVQNEINAALGNKKRYDVKADSTKTGAGGRTTETTTVGDKVTKKTTSPSGKREVTKVSTPDSESKSVAREGELKRTKSKTGLSTATKEDDVKSKSRVTAAGDTKSKTKTATDVTKTTTNKAGEETKSKTRKRVGKGLIKDVVAKGKARRDARKAGKPGKVKGSKAPEGTTYDPADDTSNMPSSMKKYKKK
jgi:hypothetical protein